MTFAEQTDQASYNRIPAEVQVRWQVVRDVISGDQVLKVGGYLPYLNKADISATNVARNSSYVQRAVFYGATGFTREGLLGLAFRLDPRSELPTKLEYLLEDADGAGTSLYQQSQAVLGHNLEVGRHGLYVDWSEALKRPVIKSYAAENIINWRYNLVDGQSVLSMVVLEETVEVAKTFGYEEQTQYRHLSLEEGRCICRIWVDDENMPGGTKLQLQIDTNGQEVEFVVLRSSGKELTKIPFQFIGSHNNDAVIDPAPLYNLAQVNVAHFRNSADYEDSVFFVGQVQPYITGLDESWRDYLQTPTDPTTGLPTGQVMYVGSRTPLLLPAGSTFGYAQAQPNTLVKEAMDQKEKQMIALGARLIEATQSGKTATGENNDREATTSVLAMCCSNVSEAYQIAIGWCADYLNMTFDPASSYKINQDFVRMAADSQIMQALVSAWQTGVMAKTDVRAFFRKLGVIPVERTDAEIDGDLEAEGPKLGAVGLEDETKPGTPTLNAPAGAQVNDA